jgi:class 3 adenylate cyclase
MSGLRSHVPEIAVEWALDAPERLWQAVDGTLCFADISGFTALAERLSRRGRMGGEELVETLSRVFGAMLDSARDRDGMLLKFGGDALLFLFRARITRCRRPARPWRCARRCARRSRSRPPSAR